MSAMTRFVCMPRPRGLADAMRPQIMRTLGFEPAA